MLSCVAAAGCAADTACPRPRATQLHRPLWLAMAVVVLHAPTAYQV